MQMRRVQQLRDSANEVHREDETTDERLWAVDLGTGELRLVRGDDALRELIAKHALPRTATAYVLSAASQVLCEIPELEAAFEARSDAGPTTSEAVPEATVGEPVVVPAEPLVAAAAAPVAEPVVATVAPVAEQAGAAPSVTAAEAASENAPAEPAKHAPDDEFSLLDRPFDGGDYYEDPPRARWIRAAGLGAVVILLVGGGYRVVHSRSVAQSAADGRGHESTAVAVAAPPSEEAAIVAPAPVAAPIPVAAPAAPIPVAAPAPAEATTPVAAPSPAAVPAARSAPAAPASTASAAAAAPTEPSDLDPSAVGAARPPSPRYSALVAEAQHQFEGGRSRRAQSLFEQALVETPGGTAALIGLAYVHLDLGRVRLAIAFFQRALDQDRANPMAMFGLAESHRQDGDLRAALTEFKTFLTLQSTGSDADLARRLVQELENGG